MRVPKTSPDFREMKVPHFPPSLISFNNCITIVHPFKKAVLDANEWQRLRHDLCQKTSFFRNRRPSLFHLYKKFLKKKLSFIFVCSQFFPRKKNCLIFIFFLRSKWNNFWTESPDLHKWSACQCCAITSEKRSQSGCLGKVCWESQGQNSATW